MPGLQTFRSTHPIYRKLAVLTEGNHDIYRNKTAMSLLRFRPEDVLCVIDSNHVGANMRELLGVDVEIPVVGTIEDAVELGVEWLVIGVSTPGGFLPDGIRHHVYDAIRHRIGVISGLHESVNGDPNLVSLSARYAVELVNLRATPDDRMVSTGKARATRAFRLLTVGTDANIGKTTASLTMERHFNKVKGYRTSARFVSTSQDGILITGTGVAVDRMISDFAGGMVERLVLDADADHQPDLLVIEGQNSILSPCYSGTAMSLVHGSCPDGMILCHNPKRKLFRHTDAPIPPLETFIELYERVLAPLHQGKVLAIVLNTLEFGSDDAAILLDRVAKATGLPVADVIREGEAGQRRIAAAVLAAMRARKDGRKAARAAQIAARKAERAAATAASAKPAKAQAPVKAKAPVNAKVQVKAKPKAKPIARHARARG